jgi:hypothetical protein
MSTQAFWWLCASLVTVWVEARSPLATAECPDVWSAQRHLVAVSKIARAFGDGIDRVYVDYTRAGFESQLDELARNRVVAIQSFLTNHLEAVHRYAWLAFEVLGGSSPISSRPSAFQFAADLTARVATTLDLIERYEYHNGNLYDAVSALARRHVLIEPDTDMGSTYGSTFGPLLQSLRRELSMATQTLQRIRPCIE